MCGIAAAIDLRFNPLLHARSALAGMSALLAHRGPDGEGLWIHPRKHVGFGHRRLKIIGLETGDQPMTDGEGNWITYNGEIYNYLELRSELGAHKFVTDSDTEVILRAYRRWGEGCLDKLRGMFAFALWDEENERLFLARDRFGIKPLYYATIGDTLYCASEAKALLPLLPAIDTDHEGLRDYLAFQFTLDGKTLFRGVRELQPGHCMIVDQRNVHTRRWWEVHFEPDLDHSELHFTSRLRQLLEDSVDFHLRADVPVGAYLSGGLDSSIVTTLAARHQGQGFVAFSGRFDAGPTYDESSYARTLAEAEGVTLHEADIGASDFVDHIASVIYHLDFPVAGPGSFPQYIVSGLASRHRKVLLGGQGADEIFGGYARYLLAYFEQCITAAIEGTMHRAPFVVTYESIIPNLRSLAAYKPMIQEFWREGLFADLDERYFTLINRSASLDHVIDWAALGDYSPLQAFLEIFRAGNVGKDSYFDRMTHFDFKTLLPALLQVEDRVSMAHGLESRTPYLDHPLVELAATLPALFKFRDGELKRALKVAAGDVLPAAILARKDKMGFPVPLSEWMRGPIRDFVGDCLSGPGARREYLHDHFNPKTLIDQEGNFGRALWGLLSLELWQRAFHDRSEYWAGLGQQFVAASVPSQDSEKVIADAATG